MHLYLRTNLPQILPELIGKDSHIVTVNDVTENEIRNAKIVAVSGVRENNVSFDGEDNNGNSISVSIDMDDVIE